jgi:Na+/H+-dicarboxylate symporter
VHRIPLAILACLFLGLITGPYIGHWESLAQFSQAVIQLIKAIAIPMLFVGIVDAMVRSVIRGSGVVRMVLVALFNACCALGIGLLLSNWLQPGQHFQLPSQMPAAEGPLKVFSGQTIDVAAFVLGAIPKSILQPFVDQSVLAVVVLALLFGYGLRQVKQSHEREHNTAFTRIENMTGGLFQAMSAIIGLIAWLLPLTVFASVARLIHQYGYGALVGLGWYVGVGLLGLTLHILVVYQAWILLYLRRSLAEFWKAAKTPVIYALGTNSSLATLPFTLRALEGDLKVSPGAARLGACVGTNLNNDGILLYEAMALLFLAQAYGFDLTFSQQLMAAFACMVAAMGIAGVPEAGIISLALVLGTVGLPTELLPLLLSVDWILARARSATNTLSDMVVSMVIDKGGVAHGGAAHGGAQ